MDIGWKVRRLLHLARRIKGSVAMRGWKATLQRALRRRDGSGIEDTATVEPAVLASPVGPSPHRRILVIETMTPDPNRDSGSMRLCKLFALLNADGWHIDFLADDDDATQGDIVRLGRLGVQVHNGSPVDYLHRQGRELDAVMLCRLPVADQYIDIVRRLAPRARVIFDTVDLHFIREERAAAINARPSLERQAARSRRRELQMVGRADVTLVVSEQERSVLRHDMPAAHVELVSNIHDVNGRARPFDARGGLIFVGGFGHPPNEDAVRWFAAHVLPRVRERDPSIVFHVVGDIDEPTRRSLAREGMHLHGRIDDLGPLLGEARVSVAPLRFGAGVKGKVNQAMSHGIPVVLTTLAAEGMHLRNGVDALVEDDADAMAAAIDRVYHDEALWTTLSDAGLENVRRHFSAAPALHSLRHALGSPST